MTGLNANARTAETYLAGFGATGALIAGVVVVFLLLVGMVTFDAWPSASSLFGEDEAGVEVAGNGPADAAAAALDDAAGLVATARPGDALVAPPVGVGGSTGTGTEGGGGVDGPGGGDGQAPVGDSPQGGTGTGTAGGGGGAVQETVDNTVSGLGDTVNETVDGLGTTVETTVDGLGRTVNDTLNGLGTLVTGLTGGASK